MYDRFLRQAGNLVLDVQLAPLQFGNLQVVRRRVGKSFVDLLLQRLVPSLEFRKMRFNCHVAYLLASELVPTPYTSTIAEKCTPNSAAAKIPRRTCRTDLWDVDQNAIIHRNLP